MIRIELKKAKVKAINIKDTIKLGIEIDLITTEELTELCKTINSTVILTLSDDQTQLPEVQEWE